DLERAAVLVFGAGVEHDVVDGHVHGVLHQRRLDLVGAADQHVGALDALVHLDHVGAGPFVAGRFALHRGACGGLLPVLGGDDGVSGDLLFNLDGHCVILGLAGDEVPGGGGVAPPRAGAGGHCDYFFLLAAFLAGAFFAGALPVVRLAAALRAGALRAAAFFVEALRAAGAFFATLRVATFLAVAFFAVAFFVAAFLVAVFLAGVFFAAALLAVALRAVFFAVAFFAAFFAVEVP